MYAYSSYLRCSTRNERVIIKEKRNNSERGKEVLGLVWYMDSVRLNILGQGFPVGFFAGELNGMGERKKDE